MRWWRRKDHEQDFERELSTHIEAEAAEQHERGLSPDEARDAARQALARRSAT
jgi:hypothetical protein